MHTFGREKKVIFLFVLVFVVGSGCLGYRKAHSDSVQQDMHKIEDYNAGLQKYDEVMAGIEENLATTQEQIDGMEAFCENSVYMKLDPLNIQVASAQYSIRAGGDDQGEILENGVNEKESYILNALTSYVKDGDMLSDIQGQLQDASSAYLQDVIGCSTTGNILTVSVRHYDADQAQTILQVIQQQMEQHKEEEAAVNGEFSMTLLGTSKYVKADVSVQNTQNSYLTSLKNYKESLAELKKDQLSQEISEKTYTEEYGPDSLEIPSTKRIMAGYLAFGFIAGIIIPCAIYALSYILSDRLKDKENLAAAGLTVLGEYQSKKGYIPTLERSMIDIELLIKKKEASGLFLDLLGEGETIQRVSADYMSRLQALNIHVSSGNNVLEDAEQMKSLIDVGHCILFVEAGKSTYYQIEEQLQMCRKFDISVWGCVVIE